MAGYAVREMKSCVVRADQHRLRTPSSSKRAYWSRNQPRCDICGANALPTWTVLIASRCSRAEARGMMIPNPSSSC